MDFLDYISIIVGYVVQLLNTVILSDYSLTFGALFISVFFFGFFFSFLFRSLKK